MLPNLAGLNADIHYVEPIDSARGGTKENPPT
jgi:hypothetical protein